MSVLSEFKKYFLVQEQKHEQLLKQWREQIEIDNAVKALKLSISNKDIDLDLAEKVVGASKYTTN